MWLLNWRSFFFFCMVASWALQQSKHHSLWCKSACVRLLLAHSVLWCGFTHKVYSVCLRAPCAVYPTVWSGDVCSFFLWCVNGLSCFVIGVIGLFLPAVVLFLFLCCFSYLVVSLQISSVKLVNQRCFFSSLSSYCCQISTDCCFWAYLDWWLWWSAVSMTHIWLTPTQDHKISQKQEVGAFQLHFGRLFKNPSLLLEITLSPPPFFPSASLPPLGRRSSKQFATNVVLTVVPTSSRTASSLPDV